MGMSDKEVMLLIAGVILCIFGGCFGWLVGAFLIYLSVKNQLDDK